jgi:hypothetical protein
MAEHARHADRGRFLAELEAEIEAQGDAEVAVRIRQAAPPVQRWLGLERYWQKRAERPR